MLTRIYLKKTLGIFEKRDDTPNKLLKEYFFIVDEELKNKMEELDNRNPVIEDLDLKDLQKKEIKIIKIDDKNQ